MLVMLCGVIAGILVSYVIGRKIEKTKGDYYVDRRRSRDRLEETIRRRAYSLWVEAGCPEDPGDEFWHAAEAPR